MSKRKIFVADNPGKDAALPLAYTTISSKVVAVHHRDPVQQQSNERVWPAFDRQASLVQQVHYTVFRRVQTVVS